MSNITLSETKNHEDGRDTLCAPHAFVVLLRLLAAYGLLCVVEQGTGKQQEHEN